MYKRGITCFDCHNVHGTRTTPTLIKPANSRCLTCHNEQTPNGPAGDVVAYTHHPVNSAGAHPLAHLPPRAARAHRQYGEPNSSQLAPQGQGRRMGARKSTGVAGGVPWRMN